jgi:hypothetical protein
VNVGQLIIGGANGAHKPKRLNVMESGPTSNFLLSVMHMYGLDNETMGDSTKAVSMS